MQASAMMTHVVLDTKQLRPLRLQASQTFEVAGIPHLNGRPSVFEKPNMRTATRSRASAQSTAVAAQDTVRVRFSTHFQVMSPSKFHALVDGSHMPRLYLPHQREIYSPRPFAITPARHMTPDLCLCVRSMACAGCIWRKLKGCGQQQRSRHLGRSSSARDVLDGWQRLGAGSGSARAR